MHVREPNGSPPAAAADTTSAPSRAPPGSRPRSSGGARAGSPAAAGRRSSPSRSSSPAASRSSGPWWSGSASDRTQIAVLEDGVLVEHYVNRSRRHQSYVGNVYLGKVQNVLPSMEAAFVDVGKGRNAVLYAGEVELRRQRARRPAQADRVGAQAGPVRDRAGHQGPGRPQGRPADQPGQPARPVPGLRARRVDDRHQPQAARHRTEPAQGHPQEGDAGERRRHRAHRGRGRRRGGAGPGRHAARRPVGEHREEGQDGQRARAALRRARPDHPGGQGRVQRGLRQADRVRRRRLGRDRRVRQVRRAAPGRAGHPLGRSNARTRSPRTGSTSSWPRRSSARSGCPAAARWSSTGPRP